MAGWSQEQTDKLVSMHREGLSSGVMAQRLFKSRSAVAGMVFRLREKGVLKDEAMIHQRRFGSKGGSVERKPKVRKAREPRQLSPNVIERSPIPLPQSEDIPRVTFAELEPHHCRFICCAEAGKAVAAGDKLYCGLQQVPGSSYCMGHLGRVSPAATVVMPHVTETPVVETAEEVTA